MGAQSHSYVGSTSVLPDTKFLYCAKWAPALLHAVYSLSMLSWCSKNTNNLPTEAATEVRFLPLERKSVAKWFHFLFSSIPLQ